MVSAPKAPRQLPLDLAHRAASSRDDLVPGASNAAAISLIDDWPRWPAPVIVLAGPAGSGKSHLAAAWREMTGAAAISAVDIPADSIGLAQAGPVLIDDADRGPVDEKGLFHLINAVRGAGHHLLLTARQAPAAWPVRLPDLASRLKAAAIVEIGAPDDMLLAGVLTKLFADRQIEVDPAVIRFLVTRMERSLEAAGPLVEALDHAALARKSKVTRALAADILAHLDAPYA